MDNIKEVLESLTAAIEQIDGGCGPCIREFVVTANDQISKFGYQYNFDGDNVTLISTYNG